MKRMNALALTATLGLTLLPGAAQATTYAFGPAGFVAYTRIDYQENRSSSDTLIGNGLPFNNQPFFGNQPQQSDISLGNGRARASAAPGTLKLGASLDAGTLYRGKASAQAAFLDFVTFTGTTDRLRITLDYRIDGLADAFMNYVEYFSPTSLPSVYLYSGLRIEALPGAGLVDINGEYTGCDQPNNAIAGNFVCGRFIERYLADPQPIAIDSSYTFEIANGSTVALLADATAIVEQFTYLNSDPFAFGFEVTDHPATSIDMLNSAVLRGVSGEGLTGVQSQLLGSLTAIDGNPGAFAYAAAVPEPQSWAMLIIGFGLTGAVMRRRAHRAVAA